MTLTSFVSPVVNLRVSINLETGTFLFLFTSHVKNKLSSRSSSVMRWSPLLSCELSLALDEFHSSTLTLSMFLFENKVAGKITSLSLYDECLCVATHLDAFFFAFVCLHIYLFLDCNFFFYISLSNQLFSCNMYSVDMHQYNEHYQTMHLWNSTILGQTIRTKLLKKESTFKND